MIRQVLPGSQSSGYPEVDNGSRCHSGQVVAIGGDEKNSEKKLKIKFIFDSILQGIVENEAYDSALINIKM